MQNTYIKTSENFSNIAQKQTPAPPRTHVDFSELMPAECAAAIYDCFEELKSKADYIAGLCDALVLAQLTGDNAEHPEAGEQLARLMQRNLNSLYDLIELAQEGLTITKAGRPPVGACLRLSQGLKVGSSGNTCEK